MRGWLAALRGSRLSPAKCFGFAGFVLAFSMGLAIALSFGPARAEGIGLEALQIPADIPGRTTGAGCNWRPSCIVLGPDDGQPHPLAVLNHGSRAALDCPKVSPYGLWAEAVAFARRGWVAVAFLRRGYGRSQGWATGRRTVDEAIKDALGSCRRPPANARSSTSTASRPTKACSVPIDQNRALDSCFDAFS
jgi:hypothetical protein